MNTTAAASHDKDARLEASRIRLRESAGRQDALEAIREIVTNLLGSEEIGLFAIEQDKLEFQLFWSFGLDENQHRVLSAESQNALERVLRGEPYVETTAWAGDAFGRYGCFSALVPICFEGSTHAVLAIGRLLPQKNGIDGSDLDLMRLLSAEAGSALYDRYRASPSGEMESLS